MQCHRSGKRLRVRPKGWEEVAGTFATPGSYFSIADIDGKDALLRVREHKQQMKAKAWELRATMSLARLLATQGRREEARTMLAEIYSWFTEGFDTADLKDAKALLDELGS